MQKNKRLYTHILYIQNDLNRNQFRGSGSDQIGLILADPDPHRGPADLDPDPFQSKVNMNYKVNNFFHKNFDKMSEILKL
jgi:hypothetical protein